MLLGFQETANLVKGAETQSMGCLECVYDSRACLGAPMSRFIDEQVYNC